MEERLLREIAEQYLVPLFSGAQLEDQPRASSSQGDLAAFLDTQHIAFKVHRGDNYRLVLTRAQPFAKIDEVIVPELEVVRAFVGVVGSMASALSDPKLREDLLSTFERRVVARAISSENRQNILLKGIDQLVRWSERLYEGNPVSAAIGFRPVNPSHKTPHLEEIGRSTFGAVMSNGHDTLLEFNFSGRFISHTSLPLKENIPPYCPLRQAPIAQWTAAGQVSRVAMCLNRAGEILVFRDRQLLFARRSGRWTFLTHNPVITQMGTPHDKNIRRAVYETCLDASFARTGACIGIVSSSKEWSWQELVDEKDNLRLSTSDKAKMLSSIVRGRKFHKLDRRLRQELVAIDGATIISHEGDVLTVGAILQIKGGSAGGGRLAAAKALGKKGLGIKVSQDGEISGYRLGRAEPAFRVM